MDKIVSCIFGELRGDGTALIFTYILGVCIFLSIERAREKTSKMLVAIANQKQRSADGQTQVDLSSTTMYIGTGQQ
jgi:hypothetical protein